MSKKIFILIVVILSCFIIGTQKVAAATDCTNGAGGCDLGYFFDKFRLIGNSLEIKGYAVSHYQIEQSHNHHYYILLIGNNTRREHIFNFEAKSRNVTLKVVHGGTAYEPCSDGNVHLYCSRYHHYAGFEGSVNLSSVIDSGDTRDTSFEVWLGIKEYNTNGNRDLRTKINTYALVVGTGDTSEYKNTIISLEQNAITDKIYNFTTGVRARKTVDGDSWNATDFGMSLASGVRNNLYVGIGTFRGVGFGYDADGVIWYAMKGSPSYTIDYAYSKNYTLQPGENTVFYETSAYSRLNGTFTYLTITKKQYATIESVSSYTSKSGTQTKVVANFKNNKSGSPVRYSLCIYPGATKSGTPVCNTNTTTQNGTITVELATTSNNSNRFVTFDIEETYTGYNRGNSGQNYGVDSILYTASNENISKSTETGSITPRNPIKVVKKPNANLEKYYEVITFNNPQNYVITEGDFNGGSIRRKTELKYESNGAGYGNIKFSGLGNSNTIQNYISNPTSTTNATVISQSDSLFKTDDTIYIAYRNLNVQEMKTTYKNVGVNNVTVVLKSSYRFDKGSNIENIDAYTMEETDKSNVSTIIKNSVNRKVRWQISYNGTKVKDGETTWNGEKTFNINEFTIPYNGIIEVKIIEPNGVISTLKGNVYVSSKEEITLTEGETYTPTNPVRVFTTQSNVQKYFETISINSINTDLNINAGEGFENKIKINYTTTSNNIPLNNDEITVVTTFPEQEFDLNFSEDVEGVHVPLDTTYTSETEHVCELPEVVVERKEGTIYKKGDSKIGEQEVLDGGRRWYTKMTAEDGKYDFYNDIKHVGANAINIKYYNQYNIKDKLIGNTQATFKVIRVQNPSNPDYKYHKTYTLSELLETFKKDGE